MQEEISSKNTQLVYDFKELKKELYGVMSIFDYLYITSLFLESNFKLRLNKIKIS